MEIVELYRIASNLGENGYTSTTPNRCFTSDGQYIVKFAENKEGVRVLINEYIVYELCLFLSINTPKPALVKINNPLHDVKLGDEIVTINAGFAFGSKLVPQVLTFFNHMQIKNVSNPSTLLDMVLLDHLIDNRDRDFNPGNVLFCNLDGKIYLIDHERVFGAGSCWDHVNLRNAAPIDELKDFINPKSIYSHIRPYHDFDSLINTSAIKFKRVTKDVLHGIIYNVPSEWKLSDADKDQLTEYLLGRFEKIDYLVELLKKHSKGGVNK